MAVVLICDVRGSRKIENWGEVYSKIEQVIKELSQVFDEDFLIPLEFTVGDEFQGVLKSPHNIYEVVKFLKIFMPVQFYCGVGIGEVEIPESRNAMRGQAFYRARDALEVCKKDKRVAYLISGKNLIDVPVNAILFFIQTIEAGWSSRQREVVTYYRLNPGLTYEKIGKHFGVTRQTIMKILKAAKFKAIREGEEAIKKLLDNVNQIQFTNNNKP